MKTIARKDKGNMRIFWIEIPLRSFINPNQYFSLWESFSFANTKQNIKNWRDRAITLEKERNWISNILALFFYGIL